MENSAQQPPMMSPSRSRTPLLENPILGDDANLPPKLGRPQLSIDPKRGENAWACIPSSASAKPNSGRQFLHGTPPRSGKRAAGGRLPLSSSNDIDAGRLLPSGIEYIEAADRHPNPAPKSTACPFPTPCTSSFSQPPARSTNLALDNFELEQDQDFWRDHNVQVIVRIRPLNAAETIANGISTCLRQESPHALAWVGQPETRFTYDHVACASTTQKKLFQAAGLPMVENCIKGYNSTIFAYGQTGSGKTYTMLGDIEASHQKLSSDCGMTPRIFEYLFTRVEMEETSHKQDQLKFTCKCSFLEIYNEQITDLLEPTSTNLQIHENPKKGIYVENLKEIQVKNVGDVMNLLLQGAANRRVAHTRMNQESSRSHSVFTCVTESQWMTDSVTSFRYGRLNLVDLAGSERQKASGAEGERLREAANINKSLSTLGLVIMILVDVAQGKQRHVPYRDSKLTFLLQDSLGGNSKTTIIATVSPAISCANETLSTLKFAQRAKFIQNNAIINEDATGDVNALQSQIQVLKKELEQLRDQAQPSRSVPSATIEDFSSSRPGCSLKKVEEIHAGCRGRPAQENNNLAVANQQLNSLLEAYERDLEYARTMLQLKEDKIQRLKRVEDTVLSAEDCLREENRVLQQELHLLKERQNNHPELLRFAFENKHLIQQFRSLDEFHNQERDMLMGELANLRKQVLEPLPIIAMQSVYNDQTHSNTQRVMHIKEISQTMEQPKGLADERMLMFDKDCQKHTTMDNGTEDKGDDVGICGFLEEGAEALDEALMQIKSVTKHSFNANENQTLNKENDIPRNDDGMRDSLQQAFDMANEIESQFKFLCHMVVGENKRKRSESMKTLLPNWGGKRMRALQTDAVNSVDALGWHPNGTYVAPQACNLPILMRDRLLHEQHCQLKGTIKSQEILIQDGLATLYADDNLPLRNGPLAEPASSSWLIKVQREMQKAGWDGFSSEREDIHCEPDAHAHPKISSAGGQHQVHSYLIQHIELALATMQEVLQADRKNSTVDNKLDEGVLEQLQNQLAELQCMLKVEGQGFHVLCALTKKLQAQKKKWSSENNNLKCQILKLQSDTVAREKEIAALQEEERTLATIVDKLHKGEEGLTTRLLALSEQLKCSESQRLRAEQLYRQTLHEIKASHFQVRLKLQNLIAEIEDGSHKFRTVKKQMETETPLKTHTLMEEGLKSLKSTGKSKLEANSWKKELEQAYQSICQVHKQVLAMETEMTDVMMVLESRLKEAEDVWREEKAMILVEREKLTLDAAENMGEAIEALKRFEHGQLIIREAELMVITLTKAMETAREQQLTLTNQWDKEREKMLSEIGELKRLIAQKAHSSHAADNGKAHSILATNSNIGNNISLSPFEQNTSERNNQPSPQESDECAHDGIELLAEENHLIEYPRDRGLDDGSDIVPMVAPSDAVEIPLALGRYDEGTSLLLEKLEGIVATLSHKQGGENAWVRFLNSFALALSKLEEDANSCLSFSNVVCETLDKTLAEKQHLEEELTRKQELLKGSFFDLSLLQERTADYLNMKNQLKSLHAELAIKSERLNGMESESATLKNEVIESTKRALSLETELLEAKEAWASITKQNAEMRESMKKSCEEIVSLEAMLAEQRQTKQKLELELSDMNLVIEKKLSPPFEDVKQELALATTENDHLKTKLATFERQLNAAQLTADTNKRLADKAQQTVEASMHCMQEQTAEIENMEGSIHELENTINALESQIETLKREAELQQLSREDLEMELQALQHQQYHDAQSSRETKGQHSAEIMALRKQLAEKSSEIKCLTVQVKELMLAAEMQATAHHQKLISLDAMADNLNLERGHLRMSSPTTKKAGERNIGKHSTSPFKCINSGLAQQISFEVDEELYQNRCRIDELQDLAASRQKEIFRLNKRLAEAEAMTYDVIRDLLGVKSDITTHALHLKLEESTKEASPQTKTALHKENELEGLRDHYTQDKLRWLEENRRRQAEVIAARFAMEKLRQKDFLLKAQNKRLKVELCRQKKQLLRMQEKLGVPCGQGHYHHQGELRRAHMLLNHLDSAEMGHTLIER